MVTWYPYLNQQIKLNIYLVWISDVFPKYRRKEDWQKLENAVTSTKKLTQKEREIAITHTAHILGRTFNEISEVYSDFATDTQPERFLNIVYWLGKLAIEESVNNNKRTVTFSPVLRERLGHHIHGEIWANTIKETLKNNLK